MLPLVRSGPIQPWLLFSVNEIKVRSFQQGTELDEVTMPSNGRWKRLRVVDVPYLMSIHLKLDRHFSTRKTMIAVDDRFSRISRAMNDMV